MGLACCCPARKSATGTQSTGMTHKNDVEEGAGLCGRKKGEEGGK